MSQKWDARLIWVNFDLPDDHFQKILKRHLISRPATFTHKLHSFSVVPSKKQNNKQQQQWTEDWLKRNITSLNEPRQANLCLRAFRNDTFQLRMPSHSEEPGIWLSVWRFLLIHCLYAQATKVLARQRGCAGSPEPSLLAWAISTKFAWCGPNHGEDCSLSKQKSLILTFTIWSCLNIYKRNSNAILYICVTIIELCHKKMYLSVEWLVIFHSHMPSHSINEPVHEIMVLIT